MSGNDQHWVLGHRSLGFALMLCDTHTHLDQEEFDAIRDEVVARAEAAGVTPIIAVGTTAVASRKCVEIAQRYPCVFAAVGIQPNYVAESAPDDWATIEKLVTAPKVVAVGETGLDRHWDYTPLDVQREFFDRHIQLARKHDLPFIVHMRDCDADILAMLRKAHEAGPLKGVMHSFTAGLDMAAECVAMGMHISFAGMVTYKKSGELRECAATVPFDRLVLETDCPYLSPEPKRSQRPNEPSLLLHTAECLAAVRKTTLTDLAAQTTANARQLFGL